MLNSNGLVFSTVHAYVLSYEISKQKTKPSQFDTVTEVWTGPAGGEDAFIPAIGTRHPTYQLMNLRDANVRWLPGLVTEVTLNYEGKLSGTSPYVSEPAITTYWQEGEVSFSYITEIKVTMGTTDESSLALGSTPYTTLYVANGIQQVNRRYIGKCADFTYITNNPNLIEPQFTTQAQPYLGFELVQDIQMGWQAGDPSGYQSVRSELICTDVNKTDRQDGWFDVKETWQSRMYVVGSITMGSGFSFSGGAIPGDSGGDGGITAPSFAFRGGKN